MTTEKSLQSKFTSLEDAAAGGGKLPEEEQEEEGVHKREQWSRKIDFLLACIGELMLNHVLHSRMLLVLNSILLCTPMLPRSYKKHRCLLNDIRVPGSYKIATRWPCKIRFQKDPFYCCCVYNVPTLLLT